MPGDGIVPPRASLLSWKLDFSNPPFLCLISAALKPPAERREDEHAGRKKPESGRRQSSFRTTFLIFSAWSVKISPSLCKETQWVTTERGGKGYKQNQKLPTAIAGFHHVQAHLQRAHGLCLWMQHKNETTDGSTSDCCLLGTSLSFYEGSNCLPPG